MTEPVLVHGSVVDEQSGDAREGVSIELTTEPPDEAEINERILDRDVTDSVGQFRLRGDSRGETHGSLENKDQKLFVVVSDDGAPGVRVPLGFPPIEDDSLEIELSSTSGGRRLLSTAAAMGIGGLAGCTDWLRSQLNEQDTENEDDVDGNGGSRSDKSDEADDGDGSGDKDGENGDNTEEGDEEEAGENDDDEDTEPGEGNGGSGGSEDGNDGGESDNDGEDDGGESDDDGEDDGGESDDDGEDGGDESDDDGEDDGDESDDDGEDDGGESDDDGEDGGDESDDDGEDEISSPDNLTAVVGEEQVELSWDSIPEADTYNVYWATESGVTTGTGSLLEDVSSPYLHAGLDGDRRYFYIVTAVADDESDPSTEVSALPTFEPPKLDPSEPDTTTRTTIQEESTFLYQGDNPIQEDVEIEKMEKHRHTVLRGRVKDRDDEPIQSVTVRIRGRPEFGKTLTRADGRFDMAINGGGAITVQFERPDYLPVQRKLRPKWGRYEDVPSVVLTEEDPNRTMVDMDVEEWQVVRASEMEDIDGKRRAKLFVPPNTSAIAVDGGTAPSRLEISATEFTVGEEGPEAMPGGLPRQVAFTYALEFFGRDPDSGSAGGSGGGSAFIDPGDRGDVEFDQPVYHYLENFTGFPVGELVPMGSFNEDTSSWEATADGNVIELLSVEEGVAAIDAVGDGDPADEELLDNMNVTDAELKFLAEEYDVGDELWRTPVPHFSSYDCNWPVSPPDVGGPEDTPDGPDTEPQDDPCEHQELWY